MIDDVLAGEMDTEARRAQMNALAGNLTRRMIDLLNDHGEKDGLACLAAAYATARWALEKCDREVLLRTARHAVAGGTLRYISDVSKILAGIIE